MPVPFRPAFAAVLALGILTILANCTLPQDVGEAAQVMKGADDPAATFAVRLVTRDTLPVLQNWPNSHPPRSLGWITHAGTSPDPLIAAGDKVSVTIWDNSDTSLLGGPGQKVVQLPGLTVTSKGTVFLPYADEVYVAKMTPDQARLAIQDKLLLIIPTAQVLLNYESGRRNSVDLVSGVPNPGSYPLPDRSMTVMNLLALGGGVPTVMANPQIRLSRDGKLYGIAATKLLGSPDLDTTLRGGDKVYLEPDTRYFTSLGAAGKEALISFPHDHVSALEAMSLVGGVQQATANPKGILILRDYPQSAVRSDGSGPSKDRMIFALDLTSADGLFSAGEFAIQDHDLVLVTQSPVVNARTVFGLIGAAFGLVTGASRVEGAL